MRQQHRDVRQARVKQWAIDCFGYNVATDRQERALRVLEEAMELCQAENILLEQADDLLRHVYSKPTGEPQQEAAGVGVTLLAYAACSGFSADLVEQLEVERITDLPPEHFRQRQEKKAAAGVALSPSGTFSGRVG